MKNYLLSLLIIGFTGCVTKDDYTLFNKAPINKAPVNQTPASEETLTQLENMQFEYKILPHDRISVIVYKHPELSTANLNSMQQERGLLVNSKGNIRLPLVKSIHVAGLTQTEAEDKIEASFRTYLKHPDIQIEVLNKRAYVVGEVRHPGEIPLLNERLTLLQILAKAGDITDEADRKSILIMRSGGSSKVRTEVVNLTDINSLRTANLMIKPNDIVYVMPNKMKAFNTRVKEIDPVFNLIGNVLQPFVSIKFLSR
jgi:polysaccharide export outer membrane protein